MQEHLTLCKRFAHQYNNTPHTVHSSTMFCSIRHARGKGTINSTCISCQMWPCLQVRPLWAVFRRASIKDSSMASCSMLLECSQHAGTGWGGVFCGPCCEVRWARWPTGAPGLMSPSSRLKCYSCTSSPSKCKAGILLYWRLVMFSPQQHVTDALIQSHNCLPSESLYVSPPTFALLFWHCCSSQGSALAGQKS